MDHGPGRSEHLLLAFAPLAIERTRRRNASSAGRDDGVRVPRVAVPLGRRVAVHLVPVDVDDHHALLQLVERGEQAVALTDCRLGVLERPGERLFQLGVLITSLGAHGLNRTAR